MRRSPAKLIGGYILACHSLDDLWPGDEHVGALNHEDEVGQGRGVDRAAGAGPHDH